MGCGPGTQSPRVYQAVNHVRVMVLKKIVAQVESTSYNDMVSYLSLVQFFLALISCVFTASYAGSLVHVACKLLIGDIVSADRLAAPAYPPSRLVQPYRSGATRHDSRSLGFSKSLFFKTLLFSVH